MSDSRACRSLFRMASVIRWKLWKLWKHTSDTVHCLTFPIALIPVSHARMFDCGYRQRSVQNESWTLDRPGQESQMMKRNLVLDPSKVKVRYLKVKLIIRCAGE